ncbi:MAG TPA: GNAT family N-acetyltransferase [Terracidiphilus sp.]|nr:GNAT family N-acetyltransferase [Terracidiphilus sp.]
MQLHCLDPLSDCRWDDLVASHPKASVFHQTGWLRALARTYSYRTMAVTSAPPGARLLNGLVFCEVKSWITGNRLVSLPFSDHTEPLLGGDDTACAMVEWLRLECRQQGWRYVEIRPLSNGINSAHVLPQSQSYWLHTLDLSISAEQLFCKLHKSCIQRRIRHAERQELTYKRGCTEELLNGFYELMMKTRRRFRLLPQPRTWFLNLMACMSPHAEIRLVSKGRKAIASILTLRHRGTVVYKYGCSDEAFHHCGAMPLLFWRLIEESKAEGATEIDFGRTDTDNDGLIRFKDSLGAIRRKLNYYRYPEGARQTASGALDLGAIRSLFSVLPDALSSRLGGMAYRHIG